MDHRPDAHGRRGSDPRWRALSWERLSRLVHEATGHDLLRVRELRGGQHAQTLLVASQDQHFVLRSFPSADDAVRREASILGRLSGLGELVPQLVAYGDDAEQPWILTSVVAGGAPPIDLPLERMAAQLGKALARVHMLDGHGLREYPTTPPTSESDIGDRARAEWGRLDRSQPVLSHHDYWCGNTLWSADELTGIVDWSGARNSPRGMDVSWCRIDLVLLGSVEAADEFVDHYERHAGLRLTDVHEWDRQCAARAVDQVESWSPNYVDIGRPELTPALLRERMGAWIANL